MQIFVGWFFRVLFLWIFYRIENEADVSTDVKGGLWREWLFHTPTALENYWKGGGNLELCSLRSSELELKGSEIAAIKSGRFYFYSCVRAQIQKPSSQRVFLLLWQLWNCLQRLQWPSASSCAKCSISKRSVRSRFPCLVRRNLTLAAAEMCSLEELPEGNGAQLSGNRFSGLEKTAEIKDEE